MKMIYEPGYPHIVRRLMPAVYVRDSVVIEDRPDFRTSLCEAVLAQIRKDGLRRCVVFGPQDAVFIEADGTFKPTTQPPSGGLIIGMTKETQ